MIVKLYQFNRISNTGEVELLFIWDKFQSLKIYFFDGIKWVPGIENWYYYYKFEPQYFMELPCNQEELLQELLIDLL